MGESKNVTRGIRVEVESRFVPERSDPGAKRWFFVYTIRITNEGDETAQLLSRHWIITDGDGSVEEVRGPGVVGEQPVLAPGHSFEYTSACPLGTNFGTMHGTYQMVTEGGDGFDVEIAPFSLAEPYAIN
jgi:ApaG protein